MNESSIVVAKENVQIKRMSRRRYLHLTVSHDYVTVKAPYYASNREIEQFILEQLPWIRTQKAKLPPQHEFSHGEQLLYLGYPHRLEIQLAQRRVEIMNGTIQLFHPNPTPESIKKQLIQFYQSQAKQHLIQRTHHFATIMQLTVYRVTVRHYRARWGSCDANGNIQYNWQLMMAPQDAIDYVIVHELSHLVHFNHSPAFWQLVRSIIPDYQSHKKWLNHHTQLLQSQFA